MGEVIIFGKKNFKKINNNMNVDQTYNINRCILWTIVWVACDL